MKIGVRIACLAAGLGLVCALGLASFTTETFAQKRDGARSAASARGGLPSSRGFSSGSSFSSSRGSAQRSKRIFTARTLRSSPSITPRVGKSPSWTRLSKRAVTPRRQAARPGITRRTAPRVTKPRAADGTAVRRTPATRRLRATAPALRKAPASTALINRGVRRNPGWKKPASVPHDAKRKAGKSGWAHRHRPFYFKHAGKRWRRHYYSYLVGGLWYWYWYDIVADADPGVVIYSDAELPDCDLDSDECTEPDTAATVLVAPAILEGRATEEAMARCRDRFRSFDDETGTYVTYGGEVRVCPDLE